MTASRFTATLSSAPTGNATGIVVPPDVIESLDHGKRPAVQVSLNGHTYRTTIGVMDGNHMIPVSAAVRAAAGLTAGDTVEVDVEVDASPRVVDVPPDFALALDAPPPTRAFFESLSNSLQRYHVDNINGAKSTDTRARRIDKSIALFRDAKSR